MEHLSLGGAVPAYMAALGIVAAAIVVALLWKSPAGPADRDTANATIEVVKTRMRVGRITRMYDCRWVNEKSAGAASVKEWLTVFVGSKYVIDGGLMEITYDTGTKVVLKGPVVYEVDSSNGGYLRVGTAAVLCRAAAAKNAGPNANTLRVGGASTPEPSLFCVHTPHSGRPTVFLFQDADVILAVDERGDVYSRAISAAVLSWDDPLTVAKNVAIPGNPLVTVGVHGSGQKPVFAISHGLPPPSKKESQASPETTVYSGGSARKRPAGGSGKGQERVPDS